MLFQENDAPLLIVLGQSNAHGHGTHLTDGEKICEPLTNVFGLSRSENQFYHLNHVVWSGFTTNGMNLGESQDHTCCLAGEFARRWQNAVDLGANLPDLFIIQISIGSQGVNPDDRSPTKPLNMWWPERPLILQPGDLQHVDISLFPLATQIFRLSIQSLLEMGKNPRIIGLHWNQWETEVYNGLNAIHQATPVYTRMRIAFEQALGMNFPLYLYRPLSPIYNNPEGISVMTRLFETIASSDPFVKMLDLTKSSLWDPNTANYGIFQEDHVHYLPEAHRWFSLQQWNDIFPD